MENAEVHILENEEESREYILQMWAEMMNLYNKGEYSLILPQHLSNELADYQARFTPEDSDAENVLAFLEETTEKYVCVSMLAYEALGYSQYERIKKTDCNRIAEILHTIPDWEPAGVQRFSKYGRQRAWKRKNEDESSDGFIDVPGQMGMPF